VPSNRPNIQMYALRTLSNVGGGVSEEWLTGPGAEVRCASCRYIKPAVGAVDVGVKTVGETDAALNYFDKIPSLMYGRLDFLRLFDSECSAHLCLGALVDCQGTKIPGYATVRPKDKVVLVRGSSESQYHGCCPECGNIVYLDIGPPLHVLRSDLPPGPIHVWNGGLLVAQELVARIERGRWKKLSVSKVRVVDEPLDGHPADLTRKVYVPPKRLTPEEEQRQIQEMLERWRQKPRLTKDDLPPHLRQMADDMERWKQEHEND